MSQNVPSKTQKCASEPKAVGSPRQRLAARLLARGRSITAVARALGVDRKTVSRWKKNPDFGDEVSHAIDVIVPLKRATKSPNGTASRWVFEGVQYATSEDYLAAVNAMLSPPSAELLAYNPFAPDAGEPAPNPR